MKQRTLLSKLKNMPGVAWLVIGVCVTALVLPSAAYAAGALKFVGIEGANLNKANVTTSGQLNTEGGIQGKSGHQADVSASGQLLTTPSDLSKLFTSNSTTAAGLNHVVVLSPLSTGEDAVVTSASIEIAGVTAGSASIAQLYISASPGCASAAPGVQEVREARSETVTDDEMTFPSGIGIPNGYSLCLQDYSGGVGVELGVASGYYVPAGSVAVP